MHTQAKSARALRLAPRLEFLSQAGARVRAPFARRALLGEQNAARWHDAVAGGRGDGNLDGSVWASGGGGASETGNVGQDSRGGDGIQTNITGTPTYLAGGGAGATRQLSSAIPGGAGGGGNGSHLTSSNTGTAGAVNTGGGGGGGPGTGSNYQRRGHPGGSGIVIIRYAI